MPRYAATTNAIEKGLENVAPEAGATIIDDWVEQLGQAGDPKLKAIAADLGKLKQEVGKGEDADSAAIKTMLNKLGEATSACADAASGVNPEKLRDLGKALSAA